MKASMSLALLITMILHTYGDQNLIETTCKNTPNYRLCTTTLRGDPGSATADVAGLALIIVKAVNAKTGEALSTINKLIKSGQQELLAALRRCSDVYNVVLKADVPEAVEALTKGDPKFADDAMRDTAGDADACDGAFRGGVAPPPLSGENKSVRDLAVVARAIIKSLL